MKYFQVWITAENKNQADGIMNLLLQKKLVGGGQIINAPARFLWKGEITDMDYYNLVVFSVDKFKERIIEEVKRISIEEVPMISFVEFEGNEELINWINETLK